ncbi:MAG TPA: hypothetical protein VLE53_09235 [Gemmatimonadaceae bacterium]|nr:hypothetical protein [Gemmatimonadaceae bacterium]
MTLGAEVAVWLAFIGAAWNAGVYLARWGARVPAPPSSGVITVMVGALLVLSWGILAGALVRGDAALALVIEGVPIRASPFNALAAMWGTVRGGLFSLSVLVALVGVALSPGRDGSREPGARHAPRALGALSALLLGVLTASLLLSPPLAPAVAARVPAAAPLHLVDPAASLAALFAIAAIAATVVVAALLIAGDRGERATLRTTVVVGWLLAALVIGAEQVVRNRFGLTARDPVVLGSSRAGLLLWLALSVLLHAGVRRALLPGAAAPAHAPRRWPMHAAHGGALLVAIAFALHIGAARTDLTLPPGAPVDASDVFGRSWEFVNQGVSQFDADGRDVTALAIAVTGPGSGASRLLSTEQRQYFGRMGAPLGAPLGVRAVWTTPLQEMRLVMDSVLAGEQVRVRVAFVPLALLWPAGIALMVVGGAALLVSRPVAADAARHAAIVKPEPSVQRFSAS